MPRLEKVEEYRGLYRHPKTGRYYLRVSIRGFGQVLRSTGERNLKKAIKAARAIEHELHQFEPGERPRAYEDVAWECFSHTKEKRAWRTRTEEETKRIFDCYLIPAFTGYRIDEITDNLWSKQMAVWKRTKSRTAYANVRKAAVMVDNYAWRKGYKRQRCDFPISDPPKREGIALTPKQMESLLSHAGGEPLLFLLCAWTMGMRHSEILGLNRDKIDAKRRCIVLEADDVKTGSKTGRGREFRISPEVWPLLEPRLKAGYWVFPHRSDPNRPRGRMRKPIDALRKAIGVHFNVHDLRHSFLTHKLLGEMKAPVLVSEYAGVSLRVIQGTYLHARAEHTSSIVEGEE